MSWANLLFLALNAALTAKLFAPLVPLLAYLACGYACVLYAGQARARHEGRWARFVEAATLFAWTAAWALAKSAPFAVDVSWAHRFPLLGLDWAQGVSLPEVAGASYVYLKVYDLVRRAQRGEPTPGLTSYLNQMLFVPSFVAGPIAGPEPFRQAPRPRRDLALEGLDRIVHGVLKLWVLASLLEPLHLLALPDAASLAKFLTRRELWACVDAGGLWIYLNFAGYSDLAIGAALLVGVRLPENFDAPYLAGNPRDFWQRWHMSFTTWLREHVFAPVSQLCQDAGLGRGVLALGIGTTATMVACGVWHRASLPFLLWGLYHAALLVAHQLYASRVKPRLARAGLEHFLGTRGYRLLAVLVNFHAIALGWVLFLPVDAPLADHLEILRRLVLP